MVVEVEWIVWYFIDWYGDLLFGDIIKFMVWDFRDNGFFRIGIWFFFKVWVLLLRKFVVVKEVI